MTCPICKSKSYDYSSYSEYGWGIVEQHGWCSRCGYRVEQAYSPIVEAFYVVKRGYKLPSGEYVANNKKKHRRLKRKSGVKNIAVNPVWVYFM